MWPSQLFGCAMSSNCYRPFLLPALTRFHLPLLSEYFYYYYYHVCVCACVYVCMWNEMRWEREREGERERERERQRERERGSVYLCYTFSPTATILVSTTWVLFIPNQTLVNHDARPKQNESERNKWKQNEKPQQSLERLWVKYLYQRSDLLPDNHSKIPVTSPAHSFQNRSPMIYHSQSLLSCFMHNTANSNNTIFALLVMYLQNSYFQKTATTIFALVIIHLQNSYFQKTATWDL